MSPRGNTSLTVVILDKDPWGRRQLAARLSREPGIQVVGEGPVDSGGVRIVQETRPDVVLVESKTGGEHGIAVVRSLVRDVPETAVIVLTSFFDQEEQDAVLRAGARAYSLKELDARRLVDLMRRHARSRCSTSPG
ncbi:Transcriptional regulatory protein LiaR [bacterium HR23]|nr:Transcriptional regulatory protein LiaR [bacterium HR23]